MRIRTTMIGAGTQADPLHHRMPTAAHFQRDSVNMTIILDIPDDDAPPQLPAVGSPQFPITPDGPILIALSPGQMVAWIARLKQRYPGAPGLDNVDVK